MAPADGAVALVDGNVTDGMHVGKILSIKLLPRVR